jgi:hypothetical protein
MQIERGCADDHGTNRLWTKTDTPIHFKKSNYSLKELSVATAAPSYKSHIFLVLAKTFVAEVQVAELSFSAHILFSSSFCCDASVHTQSQTRFP